MRIGMNATDQQTLQRAMAALQAGALADAERGFAAFLQRYPKDAAVLNLYGTLLAQMGRWAEAERAIRRAIKAGAVSDATFYNYGLVLKELNRLEDAAAAFSRAISLNPSVPETWNNRGVVLNALDRQREAVSDFLQAARLNPRYAEAHYNAARAFADLNEFDAALVAYNAALQARPDFADALVNRGLLLLDRERYAEAAESLDQAVRLQPALAQAYSALGKALFHLERFDEAKQSLDRALALRPAQRDDLLYRAGTLFELQHFEEALAAYDGILCAHADDVVAITNRGTCLHKMGRFDEALECFAKALALQPDHAEAHYGRGATLFAVEQLEAALESAERTLALKPDMDKALVLKSQLLLAQGRLVEGWALHENRFRLKKGYSHRLNYSAPRWSGEPMDGVLLVWGEQGLGDQVMYAGAIEEARVRVGKLVFEVEPRLVPLFARSFPQVEVVAAKPVPELYDGRIDMHAPVADLSCFLRRSFDAFPVRERGYLVPDPARTEELRRRLRHDRRVIGVSWISRNQFTGESKSARLGDFQPLLRLDEFHFVDLQYGDTAAEREQVARELGFTVERLPDIDNTNDIDGLAALISACDAVVTVSNTTAHLAGALGVPTWVMVPHGHVGYWYWFRGKDFSPWYPRVRVLRCAVGQPWSELAEVIAQEVGKFARSA